MACCGRIWREIISGNTGPRNLSNQVRENCRKMPKNVEYRRAGPAKFVEHRRAGPAKFVEICRIKFADRNTATTRPQHGRPAKNITAEVLKLK